jgi:SAM-dependent methyltransferase
MTYQDITRNDKNPIKRLLQRRRLADALSLIRGDARPRTIVDFGGGDGELCKRLAARFRAARILCYEPAPSLRAEAAGLLKDAATVVVASRLDQLPEGEGDLVFCMEVFEHLPPRQTAEALAAIHKLLADEGIAIIGVPLEVFVPAALKGVFRMARRYGEFDATAGNVVRAALGTPPRDRPVAEIAVGLPYHFHHLGFDHRRLRKQLEEHFAILQTVGSPFRLLGTWLNSEVYYVVRKAARPPNPANDL